MRKLTLAAVLAAATISTAAFASVTYDPASGGFVKGDVQTLLGFNNAQMNNGASGVTFTYDVTAVPITCEWITGPTHNQRTHDVDHKTSFAI